MEFWEKILGRTSREGFSLAYPPISVPTPNGLPFRANRAPSPPDEPPGVM